MHKLTSKQGLRNFFSILFPAAYVDTFLFDKFLAKNNICCSQATQLYRFTHSSTANFQIQWGSGYLTFQCPTFEWTDFKYEIQPWWLGSLERQLSHSVDWCTLAIGGSNPAVGVLNDCTSLDCDMTLPKWVLEIQRRGSMITSRKAND